MQILRTCSSGTASHVWDPRISRLAHHVNQGPFVFDVSSCSLTITPLTDIAIIVTDARHFNIPTYIVRSKADQYVQNIPMDVSYDADGDDEEDVERRNKLYIRQGYKSFRPVFLRRIELMMFVLRSPGLA